MKIRRFTLIVGEHWFDQYNQKHTRYNYLPFLGFSENQAKEKFFHSPRWFNNSENLWVCGVI